MATPTLRLDERAQKSLVQYTRAVMLSHQKRTELRNKMAYIDIAYARYISSASKNTNNDGTSGVDDEAANVSCGSLVDEVTPPIVVSQVESFVGYTADVFLSGYPMFPVVSRPAQRDEASKLQSIIDTHSVIGSYPRQLLLAMRDGFKYNLCAIENDWAPIDRYSVLSDITKPLDPMKTQKARDHYTRIKRIDPYNLILDDRVTEGLSFVPTLGEYIGYVDIHSRIQLVRDLQYYAATDFGYNTTAALHTSLGLASAVPGASTLHYYDKPQISDYMSRNGAKAGSVDFDWERWVNSMPERSSRQVTGMYEKTKIYARIIPEEHGIKSPAPKEPQIWRIEVVNGEKLVYAQRIISAYDILPILVGMPFEDGFSSQTQSVAEGQMQFQEAARKLFAIRFNAARRAVVDRAIYSTNHLSESDVNAPHPAAKIPLRPNSLKVGQTIDSVYKSIPFDPRGTETVVQDISSIIDMSRMLNGINRPQQGEFQKGNKSVQEWQDTMAGSDNRLRLPAMTFEYQLFMPLKENIKLNIMQYGPTGIFQNMKSGEPIEVTTADIEKMRTAVFMFKIADGYLPTSKIAATGMIQAGMQTIQSSPILQQAYGSSLPGMFSHLMKLGGVEGLEEYSPVEPQPIVQTPQGQQQVAAAQGVTPDATT